jgi:microcystin-dependent protein
MQGNVPMHWGQGPGLSQRDLGETGGTATVTLLQTEMPAHGHSLNAKNHEGLTGTPAANALLAKAEPGSGFYSANAPNAQLATQLISAAGGSQPHNNLQPYLALNFCIALQGVYPPRT